MNILTITSKTFSTFSMEGNVIPIHLTNNPKIYKSARIPKKKENLHLGRSTKLRERAEEGIRIMKNMGIPIDKY